MARLAVLLLLVLSVPALVLARPHTTRHKHPAVSAAVRAKRQAMLRRREISHYNITGTIHGIRFNGDGEILWHKGRCFMHFRSDNKQTVCSNNWLRRCRKDAQCKGLVKFTKSPDGTCGLLPVKLDLTVEGELTEELAGRVRFETTYAASLNVSAGNYCDFTRLPGNRLVPLGCNFDAVFKTMDLTGNYLRP